MNDVIEDSLSVLTFDKDTISTVVLKVLQQPETNERFIESNFISIITVVIATLAFFVSWRVLAVTRKHNKISIKPYLIFRINTANSFHKVELYISNKGLGPCIIEKFDIKYGGKTYTKMTDVVRALREKFNYSKNDFDSKYNSKVYPLKGYAILPNEKKILLKYMLINKSENDAKKFFEEIKKIEFTYKFHDYYKHNFKQYNKKLTFNYNKDFFIEKNENED